MARVSGSLSLIATGGVSIALRMLTVPLYLVWLGEQQYSLYLYLLFLTGFVGLTNPRVEEAAIMRLTEAFAKGETDRAWRIQQAFTALTWLIAGTGLVVFTLLGLFLPMPEHSTSHTWLMFVFFGISYAINVLGEALHPVLFAQDKFKELAVREFFISTVGAVTGIGLVYLYRTPIALACVTAMNALVGYGMLLVLTKRLYPEFRMRPRWIPEINRDLLSVGLRMYFHRATLMVSSSIDKILMPHAMPLRMLSHYTVPSQIPTTLQRIMDPIQNTLRPELTRQAMDGGTGLASSTNRFARIVLAVACCAILIPSAYGLPILALWLPAGVSMPNGATVMFALGAACTLELFHGVFNTLAYSVGKPHLLVPVSGANALATVLLTVPLARAFGVAGVAVQNMTLFAVLLPVLLWVVKRKLTPEFDVRSMLKQTAGTMGITLGFAWAAHWMCAQPWFVERPLVAVATAPLAMVSCWAVLRRSGVATTSTCRAGSGFSSFPTRVPSSWLRRVRIPSASTTKNNSPERTALRK